MSTSDVVVIGAGIIGSAVAWRCARRGLSVSVVDPAPTRGAWHTAAGMLAPTTELHYTETPLLELNLASLARYPGFVDELVDATGEDVGYQRCGAIAVAWDGADLAALHDLHVFATGLDIATEMLTGRQIRQLEPALAAGVPGGLHAPGDHQVDPRRLHHALTTACRALGVQFVDAVAEIVTSDDIVEAVRTGNDDQIATQTVVLAAGAWSAGVPGVPERARPAVRPVKGQTLLLWPPKSLRIERIVRASVRGSAVYVAPRADGRLVVGASVEETGFDDTCRAGVVYELLRDAQSVLPELSEATIDDMSVGFRPGTSDNVPFVGRSSVEGLLLATGHYRNGILLTPLTADGIAELICDGKLPDALHLASSERSVQEAT